MEACLAWEAIPGAYTPASIISRSLGRGNLLPKIRPKSSRRSKATDFEKAALITT
jgi:hypothetical protein